MEPNSLMWVGSPCGLHGPYIFYKAFRFHLEGKPRILSLGDFFFVRCKPGDPICIAELQLLWEERTSKQLLSSSKLYFLPEDTPQGRAVSHGEDEVIAVSEKVIVRLEDLVKWTVRDASCWMQGLKAMPLKPTVLRELGKNGQRETLHRYRESMLNSGLNFKDVLKEKAELGEDGEDKRVLVLSYPQYCRYRSVIARLRERPASLLTDQVVLALGGIASLTSSTQILYCRDTFEHPTLVENESVCDEFAPNLKGRPRKKKLSISQRRDSQGQNTAAKEPSGSDSKAPAKVKAETKAAAASNKPKNGSTSSSSSNGSHCKKPTSSAEEKLKPSGGDEGSEGDEEQAFLVALYKYMKERKTPIERIPYLGFKQINLWTMFQAAQKLGGYEVITARRQWKNVYDELGGNPGSTSAATCTRRHYERLILPYERYTKGEEDKPLPPVKPRKQEGNGQEGGATTTTTTAATAATTTTSPAGAKTKVPTSTKRPKEEQNHRPKLDKEPTAAAAAATVAVKDSDSPEDLKKEEVEPLQDEEKAQPKQEVQGDPESGRTKEGDEEQDDVEEVVEVKPEVKEEPESVRSLERTAPPRGALWDGGRPVSPAGDSAVAAPQTDNASGARFKDDEVFAVAAPAKPLHHPHHPHHHHHHHAIASQWQPSGVGAEFAVVPPPLSKMGRPELPAGTTKENHSHVGMVLPTLQQRPPSSSLQPLLAPEIPTERAELPGKDDATTFGYSPFLPYPKANPGIMSPLAKKKLLSQVSGTSLSSNNNNSSSSSSGGNYSYGLPPPLISSKGSGGVVIGAEEAAAAAAAVQQDGVFVNRPSVIQHAQSFRLHGGADEQQRPPSKEALQRDGSGVPPSPSETFSTQNHQHHQHHQQHQHHSHPHPHPHAQHKGQSGPTLDPYLLRAESDGGVVERPPETPRPGHAPSFPGDFYSSPHLHSLYRQAEHHLGKEHLNKYLHAREAFPRDCESGAPGFPQGQHHQPPAEGIGLGYGACLPPKDKRPSGGERTAEDQPTDLSLPKSSPPKLPSSSSPSMCSMPHAPMVPPQDLKSTNTPLPYQAASGQASSLDYHPRACRVPPMTTSTSKNPAEPLPHQPQPFPRAMEKAGHHHHNGRAESSDSIVGFKVEELARPILGTKSCPQNVGAARPLKRSLASDGLENGLPEKKVRAVTPMHCSLPSRDASCKTTRTPEPEAEPVKRADPTPTTAPTPAPRQRIRAGGPQVPLPHAHLPHLPGGLHVPDARHV
ncbi:hypothetical protein AALO_G00281530 [Alosa alosa]|uniref:AT-rich interactive domain-containing protein 5B n=1 Tax=Alosa alosa TaxID=278164 RepID=A0AAV6FNA3_9TELE|nr:hypothetical protein AALO_G00281530 [Alosa alosa]